MAGRDIRAKLLIMGAAGALLLTGLLSLGGRETGRVPALAGRAPGSSGLELAVAAYEPASHSWEIQRVDMDGQRLRIAPHPPLPVDGALSPDGRRIAFSGRAVPHWLDDPFSRRYFAAEDHQGLYTTTSTGGDVRLLHPAAACCPSWSPDGRKVAFVGDGGIWLVGADGRDARRVVRLGEAKLGIDGGIAWSADGQTLVFVGLRPVDEWTNDSGIYTVHRDGSGLTRITRAQTRRERDNGNQDVGNPSWAPDGRRIAFVRVSGVLYRDRPIATIHIVDADGGRERLVAYGHCPAWSPDGRLLAFLARGKQTAVVGVGIVRAAGGLPRIVKMRTAGCPAWTADGTRLVFFAHRERAYVVDADSGRLRRPSAGERKHVRLAPPSHQAWSVEGKFLRTEFTENDQGESWVVRIRTLAGLTAMFRQWHDDSPAWSPDGRRLAFVSTAKPAGIYVVDADGGKPRRVAAGTQPVWSPDGNWIAFEHGYPEGDGRIFVVAASGGRAWSVGVGRDPAWSPDSRWLSLGGGGLNLVRREGGEALSVDKVPTCGPWTSVKRSAWSHDGRALAFSYVTQCDDEMGTGEQSALVTRDGGSQETLGYSDRPQWAADDRGIVYLEDYPTRLVYKTAGTHPLRIGGGVRVLEARNVELFSLSHESELVAYTLVNGNESQLWLVRLDGGGRRALLRDGSYIDPTWRP